MSLTSCLDGFAPCGLTQLPSVWILPEEGGEPLKQAAEITAILYKGLNQLWHRSTDVLSGIIRVPAPWGANGQ